MAQTAAAAVAAHRLHYCKNILKSMTRDASKINRRVIRDDNHSYSLLGHTLHALFLSPPSDVPWLCKMACRLLELGADPNLLAYWINATSRPADYTCYEYAVLLSFTMTQGQVLHPLLTKLMACGGEVPRYAFDQWDEALQLHAVSRDVAVARCRHKFSHVRPLSHGHGPRLVPLAHTTRVQTVLERLWAFALGPCKGKAPDPAPNVQRLCTASCPMRDPRPQVPTKRHPFTCSACCTDGHAEYILNMRKHGKHGWTECMRCGEHNHVVSLSVD